MRGTGLSKNKKSLVTDFPTPFCAKRRPVPKRVMNPLFLSAVFSERCLNPSGGLMRISIFGLGCFGAVAGACMAESGHDVVAVDTNAVKVNHLREGRSPVVEPGLDALIASGVAKGLLKATVDYEEAVMKSDLSLICVGTPANEDGSFKLDYIRTVCSQIGVALKKKNAFHSVVLRRAVAPGTARTVAIPVLEDCSGKTAGIDFGFGNNPGLLRESTAIYDYFNPPRIVIGALDNKTAQAISSLYKGINAPELVTEIDIAEGIKHTAHTQHTRRSA